MQCIMNSFNLSSHVIISDVCLKLGVGCRHEITNVLPGSYTPFIKLYNNQVAILTVIHSPSLDRQLRWEYSNSISVDTNKAGIFSYGTCGGTDEVWRSLSLSNEDAKEYDHGIISKSGFGDGVYDIYVATDAGKVIGIALEFIPDDDTEISNFNLHLNE